MRAITNNNHLPSITPKKTPNKFVDTDFPSFKSVNKAPTNGTSHALSAPFCKCALLKNVIIPTKNKEYQMVGATTITFSDRTIRPILSRLKIHENYNRGNKITAMFPSKILTINEAKLDCTTIKKILKLQLYKGVIIQ